MPLILNSLFYVATIFDVIQYMAITAPCHLNLNLKISEFSEFYHVQKPLAPLHPAC